MAVNPRPVSNVPFKVTQARLERGKYLTEGLLKCFECHAERDETKPGAPVIEATKGGGSVIEDDGAVYLAAPNITPDKETGAGNWSDDMLVRAIREGVGHDGRALSGWMPSKSLRSLSDEDVQSVVVYLRTLPPIKRKLGGRRLNEKMGVKALSLAKPITVPIPTSDLSDPVDRGRYLVNGSGCVNCHTATGPRNPGVFGGGDTFYREVNGKEEALFSSNISSDSTGVGSWPPEVFIEVIRNGKAGTLDGTMPWQFYRNLSDEDLTAILAFLKTTVPVEHEISK